MTQLLQMAKSSGLIGVAQLAFILLSFFFGLFWVMYVRREKSLSSILLVPILIAPLAIGWAGKFWTFTQASGNIGLAAAEHKQVLMAQAISTAVTLQTLPALLIPFILLMLLVSAVVGLRFSSRSWTQALPQIVVTTLCAFIMMVNMALNFYPQQTIILICIGLIGVLGALSQTSTKKESGTSELAFTASAMVCIAISVAVMALTSWNYVIMFEAVGYAAPDHKEEMLEAGFQYLEKERLFLLAIAGLSILPPAFNALKLSGIRRGAGMASLLTLVVFTMGGLLHQDMESFIKELSGVLF